MTNLTTYPLIDDFKTTLSEAWDWAVGTIKVNAVPTFTFPSGVKCYITVNPWKSNAQVARISAYDSALKTITVDSISAEKGNGVNYSQQSHALGSEVIISDNFVFWKEIQTSLDSKADIDVANTFAGTQTFTDIDFTGTTTGGLKVKSLSTTQRDALASPANGQIIYNTTTGELNVYQAGAWIVLASGSTQPNASTTVAGKVEISTQTETEDQTTTGWTGAIVVPTNVTINPNNITSATPAIGDKVSFADVSDSNKLKSSTILWVLNLITFYYWDWSDWDVVLSWAGTTTLTRDMYYNNLTITSPAVLDPAGYRIFVKSTFSGDGTINRNGNVGWAGWAGWWAGGTAWVPATTLSQGSLNAEVASVAWSDWSSALSWNNWVSANPSLSNVNWVGGWTGGWGLWGWTWGTSTRWSWYNQIFRNLSVLAHYATWWSIALANYKTKASSWSWSGGWGNGSWGGWGGWNWGTILRIYNTIPNDCTKTLTGWAWGAWGGNWAWPAGWGGGWSWGNGWLIRIASYIRNFTGTITATGWAWGAWGASTNANGSAGSTWATGETISIIV